MKIPAINLSINSKECYLAVIASKEIFRNSIVSRVDEDKNNGYQRLLSEKRAKDIAKYLNDGNIIPGCVILSAQKKAKLKFDNNNLEFEEFPDSFFVIDGQHRLYGFNYADNDLPIPVYIFNNLDIQDEIQYFLDVNSKQVGVPKTLKIELTKFLAEPGSVDDIRLKLFDDLNSDHNSALFNRLTKTSSGTGKLSHVPFKDAIDPVINSSKMSVLKYERKYDLLNNFLNAFHEVLLEIFGHSKYLTSTVFFNAIFTNFDMICSLSLMNGGYKVENFINVISPIKDINFDNHTGTGKAANKALAEEMKLYIETNNKISEVDKLF
ncbi:DGQHR domain-containing protein [Aliarcobacter butzleri]|uniref:DGQHR domain-containing protein n=1 Tax=Aliarcobacter butzleri TaxID=28197 RepID=UPI003AF79A55